MALFDGLWLGEDQPRAALNLGGIANVTVLGRGPATARDTGPGNCLLDVAARRLTGRHFDDGGALAAGGTVDPDLLARLRAHPFFGPDAATSTGREVFGAPWLDAVLAGRPLPPRPDLVATLVALTATTVADALAPYGPAEVVASGGGTRNPVLMAALERELAPARLRRSDELGVPSDAKEAVMWALLGYLTSRGMPGTAGATGPAAPACWAASHRRRRPPRPPRPCCACWEVCGEAGRVRGLGRGRARPR